MPAALLATSTATATSGGIGCNSPPLVQTGGALVRLCVPDSWRPLQDPLIILAPEPSVEDNAFSASERLRAVEARLTQRLSASSTTLPANWATAVTSLRASGLPAIQFATDDLTDALMAFRARRGPPGGVGLLGWGVGGLIATRALEASPPYGAACVICAPIGSTASQLEYLLDLSRLFELYFPGVLPGEAVPTLDAPTQAHVVRLLNGAPETTLRLLRTAGASGIGLRASGVGRNASSSPVRVRVRARVRVRVRFSSNPNPNPNPNPNQSSSPVASALRLLREAQAWRAQQRAAFGGRAYSNLHAAYPALGLEGESAAASVEDELVSKVGRRHLTLSHLTLTLSHLTLTRSHLTLTLALTLALTLTLTLTLALALTLTLTLTRWCRARRRTRARWRRSKSTSRRAVPLLPRSAANPPHSPQSARPAPPPTRLSPHRAHAPHPTRHTPHPAFVKPLIDPLSE